MLNDVIFALRGLWRNFALTATVVASMALGIGANTAMFSAIQAVFLRPLPFPDQDRVMILSERDTASSTTQRLVSPANFVDWRSESTLIESMGTLPGWTGTTSLFNVINATGVDRVAGTYASSGFFQTLGVRPHLGRLFGDEEDTRAGLRHVLVSYEYWTRYLGSDPTVVGRTIDIDTFRGGKFSIVGVLPRSFEFPKEAQIWLSLGDWGAGPMPAPDAPQRCCPWYAVFAKLKPGVTAAQAEIELTMIARRIAQRHPQAARVSAAKVEPLREHLVASHRRGMLMLFGAVACILLIVCANVGNLLLCRGVGRRKEMMTRMALGAGQWRLARQLLIEGLLLSGLGALAGLVLAGWAQSLLRQWMSGRVPLAEEMRIDVPVLAFTVVLTLVCGAICGLAPLISSARRLNFSHRGQTEDPLGRRLRQALVVAEVAIAVTLVVNAALMLRTFMNLQGVDVGFSTRSTLAVSLDLTTGPLRGRGTAAGFLNDALARITAIPGVTAAASTTQALFSGQIAGQAITREGRPPLTQADSPHVVQSAVTPAFFGLMGMQLRNGRLLSNSDSGSGKLVAVINKRAADLYWPGEDPVGRRFAIGSRERFGFFRPPPTPGAIEWREVVGVVSDVRSAGFQSDIQPEVYFSYQQFPIYDPLLLIRTSTSSTAVVPAIRQELLALNPRAVITKVRTLEEAADTSLSDQKLRAGLLSAFSLLAVGLGILGIYGVMSYSVAQRTREIGIRMALGAGRPDITAMVVGGALRLTFAGVAVGLAVSLLTAQWMSSLLFGVSATDAPTLAIAPVLFALAAAAASYLPARRAICVDPSTSLRSE